MIDCLKRPTFDYAEEIQVSFLVYTHFYDSELCGFSIPDFYSVKLWLCFWFIENQKLHSFKHSTILDYWSVDEFISFSILNDLNFGFQTTYVVWIPNLTNQYQPKSINLHEALVISLGSWSLVYLYVLILILSMLLHRHILFILGTIPCAPKNLLSLATHFLTRTTSFPPGRTAPSKQEKSQCACANRDKSMTVCIAMS